MAGLRDRVLTWLLSGWHRLTAIGRRRQLDADLDEELRHHLAMRAEDAEGIDAESERLARVRFGGVAEIKEDCRDARRFVVLEQLGSDLGYGLRLARRQPVVSTVIILVLSLGIGINVSVFSAMHGLLFGKPAGVSHADSLVSIGRTQEGAGFDTLSWPDAEHLRSHSSALKALAIYAPVAVTIIAGDHTARTGGQIVSANFFDVLGTTMRQGRGFAPSDDRPGARVAVVSSALWDRIGGPGASTAGAIVSINQTTFDVIGVAAGGFRGFAADAAVDVWVPIGSAGQLTGARVPESARENRQAKWLVALGRLADDASIRRANQELGAIGRQIAAEFPDEYRGFGVAVVPLGRVDPGSRAELLRYWTLLGFVAGLVMVVVCFNVANMLLTRTASRSAEMALRLSLGAGRLRLIRQVLAEQAVLTIAGAAGGAIVAWLTAVGLRSLLPDPFSLMVAGSAIDWRALAVAVTVALASAAIFSLPPALMAARQSPAGQLIRLGPGQRVVRPLRLRGSLAVCQVAVSLTLLVGASLLGRSLERALHVDLGFQSAGVVSAYYEIQGTGQGRAERSAMHRRILEAARSLDGVESAALAQNSPLQGASIGGPLEVIDERGQAPQSQLVRMNAISSDFFRTIGSRVVRGREFRDDDRAESSPVALVNETCARRCFGGADPIGQYVRFFRDTTPRVVVGVVADSKYSQPLEEVRPTIYLPVSQSDAPRMSLLVKTTAPAAIVTDLPDRIRRIDASIPVYDVVTLDERLSRALWQHRLLASLVGAFSVLALVLAVLGVYGVIAQVVSSRVPEMAVRMALGAEPRRILGLVLTEGLRLVVIGVAMGAIAAWALSGTLAGFVYGIRTTDPASFAIGIVTIVAVTLAACLLPARRAASINPSHVLRQ